MNPETRRRPARRSTRRPPARAAVAALALVAATVGVATGPAAFADGTGTDEGYVMVQQAISFLVSDPGTTGTEAASRAVENALAADDQDGVDLPELRRARADLEAGRVGRARTLLQESIAEAVADVPAATGEETGTTVVLGPLPARSGLSATDGLLLALSILTAALGVSLAYLFRPSEGLTGLRQRIQDTARKPGTETPEESA